MTSDSVSQLYSFSLWRYAIVSCMPQTTTVSVVHVIKIKQQKSTVISHARVSVVMHNRINT